MPGQSHRSATQTPENSTPATSAPATTNGDQQLYGNSFIQEKLSGKAAYSDFLGQMLGSKVYEMLAGEIDDAALTKQAEKIVASGVAALRDYLSQQIEPDDKAAAEHFYKAIDSAISDLAKDAIVEGNIGSGVGQFVDTNPELVTSALVAGAVAYIVTNQDLPTLKKTFTGKMGSLSTAVDLGSTLNIAVERIQVKYKYKGDGNTFQVMGEVQPEKGDWKAQGSYRRDIHAGEHLTLSGLQTQTGEETRQRLGLDYTNNAWQTGAAYERNREGALDPVHAASAYLNYKNDDLSGHLRGTVRSDQSWDTSLGLTQQTGDRSWGVEGYAKEGPGGTGTDYGGRVFFKWQF
jgi:hypothetical protein